MVRAVCQAYASFPEALPLALQEQGATFFDATIQPVSSAAQRNALIWEPGPAVIVSSSGMLAGGPAQAYARALAGQPQHAILLTGYQDEESPGRRLQEMAARGRGTLRLGKDKVDVQCRLATYSLSAHADSGQLVSFVETLDPAQVFLVHGDEEARLSLATALRARGRRVRLPRAGQTFGFQFAPLVRPATGHGLGRGQRLDLRRLWELLVDAAGGGLGDVPVQPDDGADAPRITLDELARTWWGDQPGPTDAQLAALVALLRADTRYFVADPARPELYRLRSRAQVALANRRQAQMAAHGSLAERWLLVRNPEGEVCLARAVTVADDHVLAEESPGAGPFLVWPEDILSVLDSADEAAAARARMAATLETGGVQSMEPNRVLAFAQAHFPPAARLRRTGYRLNERVLVLTFDFPAVVRMQYAEALEDLAARTGWQIEVTPEASQEALAALVTECLPALCRVVKAPAIHRLGHRVAVSVLAGEGGEDSSTQDALAAAQEKYLAASGYTLDIAMLADGPQPAVVVAATPGSRLEINAAYAAIKAGLAGTTLYRTSLKDGVIVLVFISRQVGERHRARIDALAQQVGWPLSIYPQPNQGAILEAARRILQQRGWTAVKGPGIHLDRSEVAVTLAGPADPAEIAAAQAEFLEETGFRLALGSVPAGQSGAGTSGSSDASGAPTGASNPPLPAGRPARPSGTTVEIPIAQLRLQRIHEGLALNPAKLENAIARAQRMGQISPPVVVRRLRDGYLLLDGLYRLRAAQALGHERIPAVVEA
jgi:hypothetical protein